MSRLLLFIVLVLWSFGAQSLPGERASSRDTWIFLGGYVIALAGMWGWAIVCSRKLPGRALLRFHRGVWLMRYFIAGWFAVGIFCLHWTVVVNGLLAKMLGHAPAWPIDSPAAILGTLPALIAWIGLILLQYPADCAVRELNVPAELVSDLPVHAPPTFWRYLVANLRMEVFFILVPVAMIMLLHDLGSWVLHAMHIVEPGASSEQIAEALLTLSSAALVFLTAPLVLRHVLHTRPLADSPLRRRLEAMCKNAGLRYREILLWHTDNNTGNAAVMGVVPMVRYILLSDLLLETMNDRQIEAVFAHELGHVAHRHLIWSGVFVIILLLATIGPGAWLTDITSAHLPVWVTETAVPIAGTVAGLLLLFGVLSRFFERQADVYAARTIEWINTAFPDHTAPLPASQPPRTSHVGEYGAAVVGSALYRVAVINNISIASRNLTHGSISDRVNYLHTLSGDPARTRRFDRFMGWLYVGLIISLTTFGIWSAVVLLRLAGKMG